MATLEKILIIDDEPLIRHFLKEALQRKKLEVAVAENVKEAAIYLKQQTFDLIITDMRLPDGTGIDLIKKIKETSQQTLVVVMTAYGTVENAVEAMRLGAFHYILKPFTFDAIETLLIKAEEHLTLLNENVFLREEINNQRAHAKLIFASPVMQKILEEAKKIAKSNASVLIQGESGTGKEVIASTIHAHSLRREKPYIRVNCAAIPETLIESEFFGHEKGAFTGALTRKLGRFELANQGTLLLDEVTEIPIHLQSKLLRVIQEQEFERVGGTKPLPIDVRLISTTNRSIKEAIDQKIFREDLFYRLNVIPILLPPLRERKEDILPLAETFLEKSAQENRKKPKQFTQAAANKLKNYSWPGNIRELSNLMQRIMILDDLPLIDAEDLPLS